MPEAADPHVKALQPFLQRAEELKGADPKVAYYCRVFAMEEGLKISDKTSEMIALLGSLMETLEKTKPGAKLVSPEEDSAYCENFALRIFAKADALDRRSAASVDQPSAVAKTAKMLYVSSIFFDILRQFGDVDEDVLSKQKYAAWRAGELSACVREGRTPSKPPSLEKSLAADDANATGTEFGVENRNDACASSFSPPPPREYTPPSAPPPRSHDVGSTGGAPPGVHATPPADAALPGRESTSGTRFGTPLGVAPEEARVARLRAPAMPSPPAGLPPVTYADAIGIESVAEAQKHAKFAVSALGFEDVPTAIENLRKALALLTGRLDPEGG
jgi:vacuolar protein sorting-associated protein VTA1